MYDKDKLIKFLQTHNVLLKVRFYGDEPKIVLEHGEARIALDDEACRRVADQAFNLMVSTGHGNP